MIGLTIESRHLGGKETAKQLKTAHRKNGTFGMCKTIILRQTK